VLFSEAVNCAASSSILCEEFVHLEYEAVSLGTVFSTIRDNTVVSKSRKANTQRQCVISQTAYLILSVKRKKLCKNCLFI